MNICLITCFFGRHYCVERILKCFLNQDYEGEITLLLYNNCKISQQLDNIKLPKNRHITLINNHLDLQTVEEYTNVGDIFRDALTFVPKECNVINHFDSDDIFLPNHVSEGVKGIKEAYKNNQLAYKPYFSYYLYGENQVEKSHNTFEPSIFVDKQYLNQEGFNSVNCSYHQKWIDKLVENKQLYNPLEGCPTLLYCWQQGHNTHKISGLGDSNDNFRLHREFESESGDRLLSPANQEEVQKYYNLVKTL